MELAGAEVVPTFAAGAVDAAIVLGNQYYQLGEPPVLGDGTGINTGIQSLIVRKDVLDDPAKVAAIGDYVGRAMAANNWKDTHADQWINEYYVKQQGITFEQGKKLYEEDGLAAYYPIDEASTALFQTVADGLFDTGTTKTHVEPRAVRRRPLQRRSSRLRTPWTVSHPNRSRREHTAREGKTDDDTGSSEALDVRPQSGWTGAEIHGVDLTAASCDADQVAEIRAALLKWKVVFFRDQFIDHDDHLRFARRSVLRRRRTHCSTRSPTPTTRRSIRSSGTGSRPVTAAVAASTRRAGTPTSRRRSIRPRHRSCGPR